VARHHQPSEELTKASLPNSAPANAVGPVTSGIRARSGRMGSRRGAEFAEFMRIFLCVL
jgi:hypothetical protein